MADDNRWGDDPLLNTMTSPLAQNRTLRDLMKRFERRELEPAATDYDDDAVDAHQAEIDRVAEYRDARKHFDGFDPRNWETRFLTIPSFADPYRSETHSASENLIDEDGAEFLKNLDGISRVRRSLSRAELENLLAVVSELDIESKGRGQPTSSAARGMIRSGGHRMEPPRWAFGKEGRR